MLTGEAQPHTSGRTPQAPYVSAIPRSEAFRVVSLISAFNEEDIIEPVLAHLAEHGIESYLIDNMSTDATLERASAWLGRGLIGIETFPPREETSTKTSWRRLLERKVELAAELGADWYMHHDADEIREPPWPGASLREAVRWADELGYNAIEFRLLNFPPVDDGFTAGSDPRAHFIRWEEPAEYDRIQRKCWKAGPADVVLADGGHDVQFAGRHIFPIQFLCRHYPIRTQAHGERKVFEERKGRFTDEEIAFGWHRQYDISEDNVFLRNPATLLPFDGDIRLATLAALRLDFGNNRVGLPERAGDSAAFEGVLECVDERWIYGWARAKHEAPEPLRVEFWDGGRLVATVAADVERPDLGAAGERPRAGFSIPTPEALLDGQPHWIWATVAGSTFALRGSPMVFRANSDGGDRRVADAAAGGAPRPPRRADEPDRFGRHSLLQPRRLPR